MTSNVNATQIDETYPIAGQDNDTQGFRDNFNYIKSALTTTGTEITALQNKTAGLNVSSISDGGDFNNQIISNAVLKENSKSIINGGGVTQAAVELNHGNGDYQVFQLKTDVTFNFQVSNFIDDGNLQEFEIELRGDGTQRNVAFSTNGDYALLKDNNWPGSFTVQQTDVIHIVKIKFRKRQDGSAFPLPATVLLKYEGSYQV